MALLLINLSHKHYLVHYICIKTRLKEKENILHKYVYSHCTFFVPLFSVENSYFYFYCFVVVSTTMLKINKQFKISFILCIYLFIGNDFEKCVFSKL